MKYRTKFTVIYSKRTGKILREVWEPVRRLFWPLPWMKMPGSPEFETSKDLYSWFEENYPDEELEYYHYGESRCED